MLDRRNVATLIVTLVIRYGILDMGLTEEVHVLIRRPTNRLQTRTHHLELIFALLSACHPRKFTDFQKQSFLACFPTPERKWDKWNVSFQKLLCPDGL